MAQVRGRVQLADAHRDGPAIQLLQADPAVVCRLHLSIVNDRLESRDQVVPADSADIAIADGADQARHDPAVFLEGRGLHAFDAPAVHPALRYDSEGEGIVIGLAALDLLDRRRIAPSVDVDLGFVSRLACYADRDSRVGPNDKFFCFPSNLYARRQTFEPPLDSSI